MRRPTQALAEVAAVFFRLGCTAFGGPAAHVAMMRRELVVRRRWIDEQGFLDLFAASNLIPGPSSTEVAIFLGYVRAGWRGLIAAGVCFVLPAMVLVAALAWAYVGFGALPSAESLLYGIKPVIVAIIADALWGLAPAGIRRWWSAALGSAVLVLYLLSGNPTALLLGAGGLVAVASLIRPASRPGVPALAPLIGAKAGGAPAGIVAAASPAGIVTAAVPVGLPVAVSLVPLALTFLKIGAVTFGSGYVLLAFLRTDFVVRLGWLTDRQLLDAVAVGQFTPGPVFTTATFIGYLVAGAAGAVVATAAIFLPSFLFVAAIYPFMSRLRASPVAAAFLDGAGVAALALMAAVTWQLGRAAIRDIPTGVTAVVALAVLRRGRLNSAWLVAGGALAGAAIGLLGWAR